MRRFRTDSRRTSTGQGCPPLAHRRLDLYGSCSWPRIQEGRRSALETEESEPGPYEPLDEPVVLLDHGVQVLAHSYLTGIRQHLFFLEGIDGDRICPVLVHVDHARIPVVRTAECLLEKPVVRKNLIRTAIIDFSGQAWHNGLP